MCFRPTIIEVENNCPKCNTTNEKDAKVCTNCGEPLGEQQKAFFIPSSSSKAPSMPMPPGAPSAKPPTSVPSAPKSPGTPTPLGGPKT